MRLLPLAAAAVFALSPALSFAQTTPAAPPPAPAAPAPAVGGTMAPPAAPTAPAPARHSKRMTLQQRFDAANTPHDGHLTKDQAAAAKWAYVAKHFDAIDKDHKGYVTVDDIHAYAHAAHAAHHAKPVTPAAPAAATTN